MIPVENSPILLVDDDEVDIMYIQREFQKLKLQVVVHVARDGLEALNLLYNRENGSQPLIPKIIILDLMMPRMNGIEFLQELRNCQQFDSIPILILTTSNNEQDKTITKSLKVNSYFVKDKDFNEFLNAFKALLSERIAT
jgi:CheY-like chemotaxis protein